MTSNMYPSNPHILNKDQALIPETYKKSLESRALLQHYQASQMRKVIDERLASNEKIKDMEFSKIQNERHHRQMERKQMMKDNKKYEYSREYEEMIEMRKQREKYQKQRQLWLQQKLLQGESWLLDVSQQKQIQKMKKLQYGKQLERHLKLQEQRRLNEANKIKEQRQKMKREAEQSAIRDQMQTQLKYKRKNMLEYRQSQNLGVKAALNWSTNQITQESPDNKQPLTPRMDRMLKVQHQRYYQKGTPTEYKSESLKKYYQKQNPQLQNDPQIAYNPITNPIPYKYKNPNVLKLLSDYS